MNSVFFLLCVCVNDFCALLSILMSYLSSFCIHTGTIIITLRYNVILPKSMDLSCNLIGSLRCWHRLSNNCGVSFSTHFTATVLLVKKPTKPSGPGCNNSSSACLTSVTSSLSSLSSQLPYVQEKSDDRFPLPHHHLLCSKLPGRVQQQRSDTHTHTRVQQHIWNTHVRRMKTNLLRD